MKIIVKNGLFRHKEIVKGSTAEVMGFITSTLKDMYRKNYIQDKDLDYLKKMVCSDDKTLVEILIDLSDLATSDKDKKTKQEELDKIMGVNKEKAEKKTTAKKTPGRKKKTTVKGGK